MIRMQQMMIKSSLVLFQSMVRSIKKFSSGKNNFDGKSDRLFSLLHYSSQNRHFNLQGHRL